MVPAPCQGQRVILALEKLQRLSMEPLPLREAAPHPLLPPSPNPLAPHHPHHPRFSQLRARPKERNQTGNTEITIQRFAGTGSTYSASFTAILGAEVAEISPHRRLDPSGMRRCSAKRSFFQRTDEGKLVDHAMDCHSRVSKRRSVVTAKTRAFVAQDRAYK